jgi:hypothetical protein
MESWLRQDVGRAHHESPLTLSRYETTPANLAQPGHRGGKEGHIVKHLVCMDEQPRGTSTPQFCLRGICRLWLLDLTGLKWALSHQSP